MFQAKAKKTVGAMQRMLLRWVGGDCAYTGGMDRLLIKETGGGGMSAFVDSGHDGGLSAPWLMSALS
jgi:hypothetical protein